MQILETGAKFKVAICGGGIAGLALASFLSNTKDVSVEVYEANSQCRAEGAGLAIWKRYWTVLNALINFDKACASKKAAAPGWDGVVTGPTLRKSDVATGGTEFFALSHGFKSFPRGPVLEVFLDSIDKDTCKLVTSKPLATYTIESSNIVTLQFLDGTTTEADILIGADGIHSAVRGTMFSEIPDLVKPQFSGQFAHRMSIPQTALLNVNPLHPALSGFKFWCGKGKHINTMLAAGTVYTTAYENVSHDLNIPSSKDWVLKLPADQLTKHFADWEPDVVKMLAIPEIDSRWAIHTIANLPAFVSGPVAIIGDAAHAMTPHQGLGAGQGIEDAYILWRLLSHSKATKATLGFVMKAFDDIRRPFAQKVAADSQITGQMADFQHPGHNDETSLGELGVDMGKQTDWLADEHGCAIEGDRAVGHMLSMMGA